jgi:GNAT superfamily N-acetyltransferase
MLSATSFGKASGPVGVSQPPAVVSPEKSGDVPAGTPPRSKLARGAAAAKTRQPPTDRKGVRNDTHQPKIHVVSDRFLEEEARGHRCAHQLLDAIADQGIERKDERLVLEVNQSNLPAVRSYRSYGLSRPVGSG